MIPVACRHRQRWYDVTHLATGSPGALPVRSAVRGRARGPERERDDLLELRGREAEDERCPWCEAGLSAPYVASQAEAPPAGPAREQHLLELLGWLARPPDR